MDESSIYLSVRQFAREIGVTKEAIRKALKEGRIKAQQVDSIFIIPKSELSKWFER